MGKSDFSISTEVTDIVDFLKKPESYQDTSRDVTVKETHLSYIFLTERYVFKMKKPAHFSYLDLSKLEQRRRNCEEEIIVNKRLAPDVYMGIIPVMKDTKGNLNLEGIGEEVEWLVKMKRLPDEQMLDFKIVDQSVREEDLVKVGKKLSAFYSRPHTAKLDREFYIQRLRSSFCSHIQQLKKPEFGLSSIRLNKLFRKQLKALSDLVPSLELRAEKVVDAHGDLRPEHICLLEEPVIIDSLEFNKDLRILDPLEELAYFSLECEMVDAEWIGKKLIEIYQKETGDVADEAILNFYKSIRAVLRAYNSFNHLLENRYKGESKWKVKGEQYLRLAEKYISL